MKTTQVDPDGTVRCPNCGATSFSEKRTGKAKWGVAVTGVATLGIGALVGVAAAPKRLKCNGCGTNLRRGGGTPIRHHGSANADPARPTSEPTNSTERINFGPTPSERVESWTAAMQSKNEQVKSDFEHAKTREVGYLPEGVHPKSIRAKQIRRAQEKAARMMPTEANEARSSKSPESPDADRHQ